MKEAIINPLRLAGLLALVCAAPVFAQDARTAKVTDRAEIESQVSGVTVSNVDLRFGFLNMDNNGRVIVTTQTIIYAIPVGAVSSITQQGPTDWTVKFMGGDGPTSVEGALPEAGLLLGNSDFGSFSLPLVRLKKLDFSQPGVRIFMTATGAPGLPPSAPPSPSRTARNWRSLNCAGTKLLRSPWKTPWC